ncbi:monovalent cation/H+ antiporter complex subunit F [Georgenia sunbinii]|uniref:monovalent cation/H+ antiporter complex subunit F n=1 Tax=Georgenia sunbinii TaxID=3117728 RepID=UPI002F2655BA
MTVVYVVLAVFVLAMLPAAYRMVVGPEPADRAVAADLVFYGFVAIVILIGVVRGSDVVITIAVVATIVGFLAALSLARLITGGKR